jgi:hypothetical protein
MHDERTTFQWRAWELRRNERDAAFTLKRKNRTHRIATIILEAIRL